MFCAEDWAAMAKAYKDRQASDYVEFVQQIESVFAELSEKQEPLGAEFEAVWSDNVEKLTAPDTELRDRPSVCGLEEIEITDEMVDAAIRELNSHRWPDGTLGFVGIREALRATLNSALSARCERPRG